MAESKLRDLSIEFAVEIIKFCKLYLRGGYILFELHNNGMIYKLESENTVFCLNNDAVIIKTDKNCYDLSKMECEKSGKSFLYSDNTASFKIEYEVIDNSAFITRKICMSFTEDVELLEIGVNLDKSKKTFMYHTFFNASAAVFTRENEIGLCCGFENPYCVLDGSYLYFEPDLYLEKNERFECDLNFYGVYSLQGELISPQLNTSMIKRNGRSHPRYRNPSEGIPLYFSEIYEFNRYTRNYFDVGKKEFRFTSYNFFGNLPQRPQTDVEIQAYKEHIDAFVKIGGDTIILNPLYPNLIPADDKNSYWELFPENTAAEEIKDYAVSKGLKVGIYMGTAGNGEYGNSSMINYADVKQWKKLDIKGNISCENCIADDEFVSWFIEVQKNTIKKYNLSVWNWDPGPGNGMFCFSDKHGHTPGKGAYKGFRNSLKIMKELKSEFPDLYYIGFHGNKEYGLWGFKYIDQHEAYWENEVYIMTPVFDDLSLDRATADGIRLQSMWNYYFRFMPTTLNHGLAHRMAQACWCGILELDKVIDYNGFKFALLSAIAAGGSVTLPITPREPKKIEGYVEFYNRWITWARDNFEYSNNTIPFGAQVGCNGVDGFSKIINNEGYIFITNPFPVPLDFKLEIDNRIGFTNDKSTYYLSMIHPYEEKLKNAVYGDEISLVVPEYEVVVIKISLHDIAVSDQRPGKSLPRALEMKYNGNCATSVFFADYEIKKLIDEIKIHQNTPEIMNEYCKKLNRVNDCWANPDRIWLWIFDKAGEYADEIQCSINDCEINLKQEIYEAHGLSVKSGCFCDITDFIRFGEQNRIKVFHTNDSACEVTAYLCYPKQQPEKIPITGRKLKRKNCNAPILDNSVKILSASLNNDNIMIPEAKNIIRAKINLNPESIEGVYASVPISIGGDDEIRRDMELIYKDGYWEMEFYSGKRIHLIIDDNKICVWAVAKKNETLVESETYKIEMNWLL